jgi:adenosylhomocysteine nucleosidase
MELTAVMGAMPEETALLTNDMQQVETIELGGRIYHKGLLYGQNIITVFSRMGKVASAATTATLISHFGVSRIIFTGLAGAIDPSLNIGDVVISTQLVQHDMDASALPAYQPFEVPLLGITHFNADADMVEKASFSAQHYFSDFFNAEIDDRICSKIGITALPSVYKGIIASGDRFIAHIDEVTRLRTEIPGIMCVEMEGAAVAQVCYEYSVPFVVCRVMSDRADHAAPVDFPAFVKSIASPVTRGMVRGLISC